MNWTARRLGMVAVSLAAWCAAPMLAQVAEAPPLATEAARQPTDVPVRHVVLYSSGVGYFEHHGRVSGNAATVLNFKTEQINDLLKSLILQDLDKGRVNVITYPSQDPLGKLLKSFQVDVSKNLSRADLLKQLRGAKVTCQLHDGQRLGGTIVGVEIEKVPTGEKGDLQEIPVLNLLNEQGVANIRLPSVQYVSFDDKRLQEELNKALAALAQARDQDKKAVTIDFAGEGERRVKIGYVIETPVWKTSYRLLLDGGKNAKPFIQGWAIVENQTDTDWRDVQLSLVSGRPISFVQDLYQPLYVPRPIVQPELYASLRPREYDEGMTRAETLARPGAVAAPMAQRMSKAEARDRGAGAFADVAADALPMAAGAPATLEFQQIASAASAARLGELFQYTVGVPVNLPRQTSAMLPIIADAIEAERVSIYNASTLARHPLNGALLTNSTGKHLLNGPITVIDRGAYGGDARISDLPPGQQRLISYGIDLKVLVDSTSTNQEESIQTGRLVKGVLHLARKRVFTQQYKVENRADEPKTLVIEHPLRPNWKLVSSQKPFETTDTLYRFKLPVAGEKSETLKVQQEVTQWEAMAILPMDVEAINVHLRSGAIPQNVRDALAKAASLKHSLVEIERQIAQTRQSIQDLSQAQQRTRENMRAISSNAHSGDFYQQLLKRLADQDRQFDALQQRLDGLQQEKNKRQKELEDYLSNLSVE